MTQRIFFINIAFELVHSVLACVVLGGRVYQQCWRAACVSQRERPSPCCGRREREPVCLGKHQVRRKKCYCEASLLGPKWRDVSLSLSLSLSRVSVDSSSTVRKLSLSLISVHMDMWLALDVWLRKILRVIFVAAVQQPRDFMLEYVASPVLYLWDWRTVQTLPRACTTHVRCHVVKLTAMRHKLVCRKQPFSSHHWQWHTHG